MDERIAELLGSVVTQNAELLKQNRELIDFLKVRDSRLPERTALEIDRLKLENAEYSAHLDRISHILETMGIGRGDLETIKIMKEIGFYDGAKHIRDRLKEEGKLPEKAE